MWIIKTKQKILIISTHFLLVETLVYGSPSWPLIFLIRGSIMNLLWFFYRQVSQSLSHNYLTILFLTNLSVSHHLNLKFSLYTINNSLGLWPPPSQIDFGVDRSDAYDQCCSSPKPLQLQTHLPISIPHILSFPRSLFSFQFLYRNVFLISHFLNLLNA